MPAVLWFCEANVTPNMMPIDRYSSALGWSLALIVAAMHPLAVAQEPPEFSIGHRGWTGGAFANEEGQFSHCGVERDFENGVRVILSLDNAQQTTIALVNAEWSLEPNQRWLTTLTIDEGFRQEFPALPVNETAFILPIGVHAELFELMRQGGEMTVQMPDETLVFPLAGTSVAFGAVRQCVETANRLVAENPELEAAPASPLPTSEGLSLQALAEILDRAGLEELAFMRPEEIPDNVLDLRHVWRVGESLVGGFHQRPRGQEIAIDAFAEAYTDAFGALCTAEMSRDLGETSVIRDVYALKSATLQCGDGEEADFVALFFALDDRSYTVFFHQTSAADRESALAATDGVRQVIRELAETPPPAESPESPAP